MYRDVVSFLPAAARELPDTEPKVFEALADSLFCHDLGIEMMLRDLYLKRFDWTKDLLLKLLKLLFGTNCVVVITQYWSCNHFHRQ